MIKRPAEATHEWLFGHLREFARRVGPWWEVWRDGRWYTIGNETRGSFVALPAADPEWWKVPGSDGIFTYRQLIEAGWLDTDLGRCGTRVEAPKPAAEAAAWVGVGLPQEGTHLEWHSDQYGWIGGTVVGYDGKTSIIRHNDGYAGCYAERLRPIELTVSESERKTAIEELIRDIRAVNGNGFYSIAEDLYDAGYRKQVQP